MPGTRPPAGRVVHGTATPGRKPALGAVTKQPVTARSSGEQALTWTRKSTREGSSTELTGAQHHASSLALGTLVPFAASRTRLAGGRKCSGLRVDACFTGDGSGCHADDTGPVLDAATAPPTWATEYTTMTAGWPPAHVADAHALRDARTRSIRAAQDRWGAAIEQRAIEFAAAAAAAADGRVASIRRQRERYEAAVHGVAPSSL